jgi:precorrin-8X/cobalt-precorrin-8 methylmutase
MAAPVFDAYVAVDWSAAGRPATGPDSVWLAWREGEAADSRNPPTRAAAMTALADLLSDMIARGRSVLVGFDFCFGFPAGFAQRLGEQDWRGVWRHIAQAIRDDDDNANNRFPVAAGLNARLAGGGGPFWGCPPGTPDLSPTRPADYAGLPERRLAEERLPATKPVWQLSYAGAVGGQTLVGIPRLHALRRHPWVADATRIWPFETGLKRLERIAGPRVVLAEIYPSLVPAAPGIKDRGQVRAMVDWMATEDGAGRLGPRFAGDPGLSDAERRRAETEEGWILGAGGDPAVQDWLRDPAEIYRRSFAAIAAEADLGGVPDDLRALVVRVIHACGMTDLPGRMGWSDGAGAAGRAALAAGRPILTDARMVADGIIRRRLSAANPVLCTLEEVGEVAGTTRSAAAIDLWQPHLGGAVVAIGNAPTALFRLLELVRDGGPRPALVLGFPVGFVGAAESKEALAVSGLPYVTLFGRRGGSAMAAAAINALAGEPS